MSSYFSENFLCWFFFLDPPRAGSPTLTFDLSPPALQFAGVLDGVLSKLSRYDEGTLFSSILSFTVSPRFILSLLLPSIPPPPLHRLLVFLLLSLSPSSSSSSSSAFSFFRTARCSGRGRALRGQRSRVNEQWPPGVKMLQRHHRPSLCLF